MNSTSLWSLSRNKNVHGMKDVPAEKNMAYSGHSFNKSSPDNNKGPAQGGEHEPVGVTSCKL